MDDSSILESSLFFSCISSASAGDEAENGSANEQTTAAAAMHPPTELSVKDDSDGVPAEEPYPTPAAEARATSPGIGSPVASDPSSSNSSWSIIPEKERPVVRSITFNRDRTCLIVSTSTGVRIRTLESLSLQHLNDDDNHNQSWTYDVHLLPDGATYAQLMHSSSLLAVVKPSSPRCCFLYNAKSASKPLAALPLSAAVKRVELQRRCLVALTVDLRLQIFHMMDGGCDVQQHDNTADKKALRPTLVTTLNIMHPSDSPRNVTRGLDAFNSGCYFDLWTDESNPLLVCKSFNGTPGTVRVYDPTIVHTTTHAASCSASVSSGQSTTSSWDKHNSPPATKRTKRRIHLLTTINAHDHAVTRMLMGGDGKDNQTFLATVSSKGTAVRVFALPSGDHLWEWHRGSRPCQFHSLSWNGTADRLASFGSSGTIHVFDWQKKKQRKETAESDEGHDVDFEKVDDDVPNRAIDATKPEAAASKPLLRRIGSSIKRSATGSNANPVKHRSMTKLKYKPSLLPNTSSSHANSAKSQPLVLALLDRNDAEDRLVVCSMEGELRQYSVKNDKTIALIRDEDVVLARK